MVGRGQFIDVTPEVQNQLPLAVIQLSDYVHGDPTNAQRINRLLLST